MEIQVIDVPVETLEQAREEIRRLSTALNKQAGRLAEEMLGRRRLADQAEQLHQSLGQARMALHDAGYPIGSDIAMVIRDLHAKWHRAMHAEMLLEYKRDESKSNLGTPVERPISFRSVKTKFLK